MSISEMFILINSRWKLFFGSEMHLLTPCCPVLKLLSFEANAVEILCNNLLEMFEMSNTSSLHGPQEVSGILIMFSGGTQWSSSKGKPHEGFGAPTCSNLPILILETRPHLSVRVLETGEISSPLFTQPPRQKYKQYIAWLGSKIVNPILKIPHKSEENQNLGSVQILECKMSKEKPQNSFKPYLFLNFGGKKVFDPEGTLHPTILKDVDCLYEHPINGGLQFELGINYLGKSVQFRKLFDPGIHTWACDQPLTKANQGNEVLKYEYGNGITQQVPFAILIYDPGGSHVTWSLEVAFKLERV